MADPGLTAGRRSLGALMAGGLGGQGAGGGAEGKPFGRAGDATEDAAAFGGAEGGVALLGEGGGLGLFVGEVALGGDEFRLAGLAIEGEVVEGAEVGGGDDGVGGNGGGFVGGIGWEVGWRGGVGVAGFAGGRARARPYSSLLAGSLQRDGRGERDRFGESVEDLRGSDDGLFELSDFGERLREGGVAVFLVSGCFGDGLLRSGELRSELGAVAAVGLPGENEGDGDRGGDERLRETEPDAGSHGRPLRGNCDDQRTDQAIY